jgi:hypothetical protein
MNSKVKEMNCCVDECIPGTAQRQELGRLDIPVFLCDTVGVWPCVFVG